MDEPREPFEKANAQEDDAKRPLQERRGRLEDLLFQGSHDPLQTTIMTSEVRTVAAGRRIWIGLSLFLLLILAGGGLLYLFWPAGPKTSPPIGAVLSSAEQRLPMPPRPADDTAGQKTPAEREPKTSAVADHREPVSGEAVTEPTALAPEPVAVRGEVFRLVVGPLMTAGELQWARDLLNGLGLPVEKRPGHGPVRMTRLLEGRYADREAAVRLEQLKQLAPGAFLMPEEGRSALYAGSFHDPGEADKARAALRLRGVSVENLEVQVLMNGTLLVSRLETDRQTAEALMQRLAREGLNVRIQQQENAPE